MTRWLATAMSNERARGLPHRMWNPEGVGVLRLRNTADRIAALVLQPHFVMEPGVVA
jgi:hypothetical protein